MATDGRRHFEQTQIMLRPVGSGLPLGFFSFGIGMLLLGSQATGWIPVDEQRDVGLLLAFVFPLELVAMLFAFLARDTLGRRDHARPVHDVGLESEPGVRPQL